MPFCVLEVLVVFVSLNSPCIVQIYGEVARKGYMREMKALRNSVMLAIIMVAAVELVLAQHRRTASRTDTVAAEVSTQPQLYTCGMHPQVVENHPGICPICHMKLVPMRADTDELPETVGSTEHKIKYYWDPMLGPASISDKPGKSAMGMDLVPVYEDGERNGPAVRIDPSVVQNIGIRTAKVLEAPLVQSIRAVGVLMLPEPGLHDLSLKVNGWIEKLYADKDGMALKRGDPLFELYSPELQVAEEEFIAAARTVHALGKKPTEASGENDEFLQTAREKLKLFGIADSEIDYLLNLRRAPRTILFRSPSAGHIEDKSIVEGSAVQAGTKLLRIADHSTLWFEVQLYSADIPLVALGNEVEALIDGVPAKTFKGPIIFVYPHLDHMTRTLRLRIALTNPNFELKPGMYGTAIIRPESKKHVLQVPREAVIDTGEKQLAFVVAANGRFEPRNVRMGLPGDDKVEILSGLSLGETVVTSGQFLLDVESRTAEAIAKIRRPQTEEQAPAMESGR